MANAGETDLFNKMAHSAIEKALKGLSYQENRNARADIEHCLFL